MNEAEKERLIKKDIESIENRVRHAFNQGYEMGLKENKSEMSEALDMAIKALEQENILDKIRAEIMDFEEELFHRPNTDYSDYAAVRHCVEIIDKYNAESEEKK